MDEGTDASDLGFPLRQALRSPRRLLAHRVPETAGRICSDGIRGPSGGAPPNSGQVNLHADYPSGNERRRSVWRSESVQTNQPTPRQLSS